MLINEVEPIKDPGVMLLNKDNSAEVIDTIIELPLRKACKIFLNKGIQTIMSSANRNNLLNPSKKSIHKEDLNAMQYFDPKPTFEDAGRGYAWIMINFDTLSNENKDMLFEYEEKSELGQDLIWFVHPFNIGNIDYKIATGQFSMDFVKSVLSESQIENLGNIKFDHRLAKFEKKHVILSYNGRYPVNSVFLRMPINETSTVEDVEKFFIKFAELFKDQKNIRLTQENINEDLSL